MLVSERSSASPGSASRSAGAGTGDPHWQPKMAMRKGAPPLRFKGHELARFERTSSGLSASIILWKRKTKGYVAGVETAELTDAVSVNTLGEVCDWLEGLSAPVHPRPGALSLDEILKRTPASATARRILRIEIGKALDHLDRLQEHATK